MNKIRFIILFSSCLVILSCGKKPTPPPAPISVNLFTVKAEPVVYYDRYTSTTVALSQVNLLPEVQGYITGMHFKEGSHVKKGQKLYDIDRRIYEGNYNAAAANLKVAEGNLKQAQQDADRYTYLNNNKAVAKQVYDHAIITLENAQNAYKAADEALKNTRTNLAYSEITAPFDGTIGFSMVKLGDLMTPGQTILNTISSDDPMGVDFLINEKQLTYFDKLQDIKNNSLDSMFTLILPNNTMYPFEGKISVIDRAVNPQTGAIRIRLVFPNPKYYLRAGMSCVVRVHNQDLTPQIVIPNKAVVEQMGEYFIYVTKDSIINDPADKSGKEHSSIPKKGLFALQKKVHPGTTIGPNIIIKDGINPGEKIIMDGLQSLHDGSQVIVSEKSPDGQMGKNAGGKHVHSKDGQ